MIRKFHDYFVPVLKYLNDTVPTYQKILKEDLAKIENLTDQDLTQTSERGTNIFSSRIHWALQYLYQSGALQRPAKRPLLVLELCRLLWL